VRMEDRGIVTLFCSTLLALCGNGAVDPGGTESKN
jgi:hypothetical protein